MSNLEPAKYERTSVYNQPVSEPKYLFRCLGEKLKGQSIHSLIDVGCAAGELLGHLTSVLDVRTATGVDIDQELIGIAKTRYPKINFISGSFLDAVELPACDVLTMTGVLSVFDDPKTVLDKAISLVQSGGRLLIVSIFNEYGVDSLIRWKYSASDKYNLGYNHFSIQTISGILSENQRVEKFSFEKFRLPFDLAKNDQDPIRTWTEKDSKGENILVNGLGMEINLQTLEVKIK